MKLTGSHLDFMSRLGLLAALHLPLNTLSEWQVLEYKKIKPNRVEAKSEGGLKIYVESSASPLVHALKKPTLVQRLEFSGQVSALIDFKKNQTQGDSGADDFVLRVGLVYSGDKNLNAFQRFTAADWVKRLFALAPKGMGIKEIVFYNLVQQESLVEKSRRHPKSELLVEKFVKLMDRPGPFHVEVDLPPGPPVVAVWLAVDGDDTKSTFVVHLDKIWLTEAAEPSKPNAEGIGL